MEWKTLKGRWGCREENKCDGPDWRELKCREKTEISFKMKARLCLFFVKLRQTDLTFVVSLEPVWNSSGNSPVRLEGWFWGRCQQSQLSQEETQDTWCVGFMSCNIKSDPISWFHPPTPSHAVWFQTTVKGDVFIVEHSDSQTWSNTLLDAKLHVQLRGPTLQTRLLSLFVLQQISQMLTHFKSEWCSSYL